VGPLCDFGDSTHFPSQFSRGHKEPPISQRWGTELHQVLGGHRNLIDIHWAALIIIHNTGQEKNWTVHTIATWIANNNSYDLERHSVHRIILFFVWNKTYLSNIASLKYSLNKNNNILVHVTRPLIPALPRTGIHRARKLTSVDSANVNAVDLSVHWSFAVAVYCLVKRSEALVIWSPFCETVGIR